LLAARTRSGLVETYHDGAVAVVSKDGDLIASSGDIDRPFYLRSAAKPFQAAVAQRHGAGLLPTELALASASHDGHPVHVAIVESMLDVAGLSASDLRCPAGWPNSQAAARRHLLEGRSAPRRQWHNCSGKHAGWLRACVASGFPVDTYLSPDHPLQSAIASYVTELSGMPVEPVGVDGCGAPVLGTTTRAMATVFARLASLAELREVFEVMHRYPALVSGNGNGDAEIATWLDAAAKRGAAGCLGVGIRDRLGVAVKSWDGAQEVAEVGMLAALSSLGVTTPLASDRLSHIARPPTLGGGDEVGGLESQVELRYT
jgi:L-asparaginase II